LSSETSISSSAYSFYELPESANSSDSQSQILLLGDSQYDGAAHSRPVSGTGGAYHSIRLSHDIPARAPFGFSPPSRVPSQLFEAHPGPGHGVSLLPARPYSRGSSTQQSSRLSTNLMTQNDLIGGDQDAVRALQSGLTISPLDRVEERATSYLDRIAAGMRVGAAPPGLQHQVTDMDPLQARQRRQRWQAATQPPPANGQPRWNNAPQSQRRGAVAARAGQRSSENMPVGAPSQEERLDRRMRAQPRLAFRPRPNPPPAGANM